MTADDLLLLIERQTANYRELAELSSRQTSGAWDPDALLAHARAKAAVMGRVDAAERELAPVKDGWEGLLAALPEERRPEVSLRMRSMRDVLARVIELEEANQAGMERRMVEIKAELDRTARARIIQRTYGPKTSPENRFVDREQ
ncbi:MAG: hypothetical protein HY720_20120 [Planctomycetes bacterium]|nr:hypothetical protein [Planctomycetota bacterium]